jgi:hypothetical protein
MYGNFPANNTVYALYVHINVWFWPTLLLNEHLPAERCKFDTLGREIAKYTVIYGAYTYGFGHHMLECAALDCM